MIKKRIIISALVLTMCANAALLASCGRQNETTEDRGEGNTATQTPENNSGLGDALGDIGSDIGEGVGDIVEEVPGNGDNGNGDNGNGAANENQTPANPGMGARSRNFPTGK